MYMVHVGERMKSPMLYGQIRSFNCDSFYMGDLDCTRLHYLAVRKATVSVHSSGVGTVAAVAALAATLFRP